MVYVGNENVVVSLEQLEHINTLWIAQNWLSYQFTCLQVLDFLKAKDTFISLLLKHIGTSAIMDLMLKLMTQVEGVEMNQNILNVSIFLIISFGFCTTFDFFGGFIVVGQPESGPIFGISVESESGQRETLQRCSIAV